MGESRGSRPANRSHFERLISEVSKREGVQPARLRRWISQMMIMGAVDRATEGVGSRVVLKGGVTMELRFSLSARATRDLDTIVMGSVEDAEVLLAKAFEEPYEGFRFQITPPQAITNTDAFQCDVKLAYEGRPWATEKLEFTISSETIESEDLASIDLSEFGVKTPARVECLSLRYQIAQKLHAVSAKWEGAENPRFRDVIDLVLMSNIANDLASIRAACTGVFNARATHTWPPTLTGYDSWQLPYETLATELGVEPANLKDALKHVNEFIQRIDRAR